MFDSNPATLAPAATDFSRFGSLRAEAANGRSDTAVGAVAREFEAVFIGMMLKTARAAMPNSGLFDSSRMELFQDMFDQQIALSMSERGAVGVAKAIEAQLAHLNPSSAPEGKQARAIAGQAITSAMSSAAATAAVDADTHAYSNADDIKNERPAQHAEHSPRSTAEFAHTISPAAAPEADPGAGSHHMHRDPALMILDTRSAGAIRPTQPGVGLDLDPFAPTSFATARRTVLPPAHLIDSTAHQMDFVQKIAPAVTRAAEMLNVPAAGIAAQAILETGWGAHVMLGDDGRSSHNLFGVKAGRQWAGPSVGVDTREFIDGRAFTVNARFRAYPDVESAVADYTSLLSKGRYAEVRGQQSVDGFARALERAGYATDPDYAEKISQIARQIAPTGHLHLAGAEAPEAVVQ